MMIEITVTLDDFTFQDFEVPETINLGGSQMLAIHKMIGGKRIIDAMGPDDDAVSWSGRFRGLDALSRARTLDAKRKAGKAVPLAWGEQSLTVVISHFKYETQFGGLEVPYQIALEVVEERELQGEPGLDEMTLGDQAAMDDWADELDDDEFDPYMEDFDGVMAGVPSFADADVNTLGSVLSSLNGVRSQITGMIEDNEADIVGLVPFGIARSNPAAQLAAVVLGQTQGLARNYRLYEMANFAGRMASNLENRAGILASLPAISGVYAPVEPDYAGSLLFNTGLRPTAPGQQGGGGSSAGGTYDFPDWETDFLSRLDFTVGNVVIGNGLPSGTFNFPDWDTQFLSSLDFNVPT